VQIRRADNGTYLIGHLEVSILATEAASLAFVSLLELILAYALKVGYDLAKLMHIWISLAPYPKSVTDKFVVPSFTKFGALLLSDLHTMTVDSNRLFISPGRMYREKGSVTGVLAETGSPLLINQDILLKM